MVAIVHLTCKGGETNRKEWFHLDALDTHPLKESVLHAPTAHIIEEHTHLDPFSSFRNQCIRHESSQRIILEDIDIDMDMTAGRGNIAQQGREKLVAISKNLHLIIIKGQREAFVDKEVDDGFIVLGQLQVMLFHKTKHRTFGQLVHRALTNHPFPSGVNAKEHVGDNAYHRQEPNHHDPSHRLGRLTIIHHHVDNSRNDDYLVNDE